MDERSEAALASVDPVLAAKVRRGAAELAAHGTFVLVVSGLRSGAEQDALYAQGRTAPGHIVTKAKAGQSMHNYGLAVDIVPYLSGPSGRVNYKENTPQYRAMVSALESQDLVWGGSWKSFPDYDHFQLPGVPPSPTARMFEDYGTGSDADLLAIWEKVANNLYAV